MLYFMFLGSLSSGVKVWGLKVAKEMADMKVSSGERGGESTQYPAVLLCVMQLVF